MLLAIQVTTALTTRAWLCRRVRAERELQHAEATDEEKQNVLKALQRQERDFLRLQRQRLSAADFEPLTIIGRGAFGEVCLPMSHP
jgi:serine/threonine kinase 38